ncbi:MAG: T9SS type A sorting domain-containing protein [Chitinophagaceae bacterium]
MKNFLLIAFILLIKFSVSAQNNCDSLMRTYGSTHVSSKLFITNDGANLFAGRYQANNIDSATYFEKIDSCGNKKWNKFFAVNPGYQYYYAKAFDQSSTGNLFALIDADSAVNNSNNQMRLLKINANGNLQWMINYAETGFDIVPYGICATADGGALAGGWKGFWFAQTNAALLVKFSNNGSVEWTKTYGNGLISSIKQTPDGGYVFIRFYPTKSQLHSYLYKINSKGKLQWSVETPPNYKYKYSDQYSDWAVQVLPQTDNGYTVVRTQGAGFYPDTIFLTKYNGSGMELWTKFYSYLSYQDIHSIQNTKDGGYLLCGNYSHPVNDTFGVYLMRLNENGDTVFTKEVTRSHIDYNTYPHIYTSGTDAYELTNNNYVIGGLQQTNTQQKIHYASLLIKLNVEENIQFTDVKKIKTQQSNNQLINIFPNPAGSSCTIEIKNIKTRNAQLKIIDVYGKTVQIINCNSSQQFIKLNTSLFTRGFYLVNITSDNKCISTSKLIIQ